MAERREITGEHSLLDIRMGRPYSPTDPNHIPNSWTPTPDEYQLFAAERARFSMNRHWEQFGMISPNMRAFDYSNILPQTGSISGGVTLTHRPMPRYGPQLQFGEDCKTVRPRCPTCVNVDYISFGGMDAVYSLEREKREIMIEHLRVVVFTCGYLWLLVVMAYLIDFLGLFSSYRNLLYTKLKEISLRFQGAL